MTTTAPRVGDTITTAEDVPALPHGAVVQGRHGQAYLVLNGGVFAAGNEKRLDVADLDIGKPFTVLYVPGEPSRPSVTDNARADVLAAHQVESRGATASTPDRCTCGEAVPPEPDPTTEGPAVPIEVRRRRAFAAHQARALAAGRAETTTGAIARGEALAAGDPDWMNVTRWPQDATTTATTEDAARVLDDVIQHLRKIWSTGHDEAREVIDTAEELLAQALPRLLATARTRPTRDELAKVICESRCSPQRKSWLETADAVLALLADQPTEAEAGARALEQAAEWLRSDMDEPWGDRAANRLDVRAARIRAGGAR